MRGPSVWPASDAAGRACAPAAAPAKAAASAPLTMTNCLDDNLRTAS